MSQAETQEITNTEVEEQQVPENLTLRELDQIAQVIDLASSRGAFRGGELQTVGTLYNKLANFLSFVQAQQNSAAEAAEKETSSDEESDA